MQPMKNAMIPSVGWEAGFLPTATRDIPTIRHGIGEAVWGDPKKMVWS